MKNLVIMKDSQAVTSSLDVADTFEKNHQHVLRDLDGLKEGVQNWTDLYWEDTYIHPQNKQPYRMIYMNRDGFALLAMGFTGKRALQFKLKYIQAFNAMESRVKDASLMSPEDIMIATLEAQKEFKANLRLVQDDVADLKQEINLSRLQKSHLSKLVRANAMAAVGGKKSNAYKKLYRVAISEHWREIKNYFNVASYEEIPKLKFEDAMDIAGMWNPSIELAYEIKRLNSQVELEV
ncbi:Rha family transcriptional regulator [Desemzia incerta]|uniref:Rha family transcriptional regulator n=1 Tax=Desemzia incerta TaxID=82801 RepID=UPI003D06CE63